MAMSEISAEEKSFTAGPLGEPAPRRGTSWENGFQFTSEQLESDEILKGSRFQLLP
jgi:hypothetical protein